MSDQPIISVIMPVYKEERDILQAAIDSILQQTINKIELILILDSDVHFDYVNSLEDKRLQVLLNETNLGAYQSRKKGITIANGDYIAFMDADDISKPERFEVELNYLKEHDLDIVGSNILYCTDDLKPIFSRKYPERITDDDIKFESPLAFASSLVKKSVFDTINFGDDKYVEDYAFWLKAYVNKFKMGNVQEELYLYRQAHATVSKKKIQLKCYLNLRNKYRKEKVFHYSFLETMHFFILHVISYMPNAIIAALIYFQMKRTHKESS